MTSDDYLQARETARRIASRREEPLFYREQAKARTYSRHCFTESEVVDACLSLLRAESPSYGHGMSHAEKVAVDAGAIVFVELSGKYSEKELKRLITLAQLAGLLHDIERSLPDHAQRGAKRATVILKRLNLPKKDICIVAKAISNHEAFKPSEPLDDSEARLVSDALYDADKFRWGPDNFTEMLWDMLSLRPIPMPLLLERFLPGLKAMQKIRDTFRSETGKTYGPDFIDRGIDIGRELYEELAASESKGAKGLGNQAKQNNG